MKSEDKSIKLLIDSMTSSEKRMFKVYNSTYSGQKKYIELFEAIEKQKVYNEKELKQIFSGNFAVLKKYLFDSIIDSIKISGDYKDLDSLHSEEIEKYKILLHKGLTHAAEIQLRRVKKMTFEDEGFIKHLYTLNQEYISVFAKDTNLGKSKLKQVIAERQKIFEIITNYSYVSDVYFTLRLALKNIYYCKNLNEKKLLKTIVDPLKNIKNEDLLSDTAKSLFYMTMNEYYSAIGEYEKALVSSTTYLNIKRGKNGNKVELQTILENANYLLLSMKCLKFENFKPKLQWYEDIMNSSTQPYRFLFCYERWYVIKLRYSQLMGKKNESIEFIQHESNRFNQLNASFSLKYKAAAYYFNAMSHYINNDYKSALRDCNHIINNIEPEIEEYLYARILRLFIFIQQKNYTPLEHDTRNLKRTLKQEITTRKNELKLVDYIEKEQSCTGKIWKQFIESHIEIFRSDKNFSYYLELIIFSNHV